LFLGADEGTGARTGLLDGVGCRDRRALSLQPREPHPAYELELGSPKRRSHDRQRLERA
jgi:hypothetical protein